MDSIMKPELENCHIDDISETSQMILAELDPEEEKRLIRKCDSNVIPILTILYLLAFLDRINIGNARLQGLEKDLNMKGNDYNIVLFIFFIPYILCEVPCNIIMKKLAPSTWISSIMFFWGIVTVCQGFVQNMGGLVACRVLIGVFEAGFLPGCVYLISMYYKRYELQWRFNLFFTASILAGAVSGLRPGQENHSVAKYWLIIMQLLAYGLAYMNGVGSYSSWRWIFILEGTVTVMGALISKWFIVDWPETAKFISEPERRILLVRLKEDQGTYRMDRLDRPALRRILTDSSKIYIGTLMYLGALNTGYATSFFIPTTLKEMGYTSILAQAISFPIYIVAAISTLSVAFISDRVKHRFGFAIAGCLISIVGYIILLNQQSISTGVKYFALYTITAGGFITQPILIGWLSNNISRHYKKAIASAVQIGFGNCGGFVASNIFMTSEAPYYRTGYGISLGLIWVTGVCSVIFLLILTRENRQREHGKRDHLLELSENEVNNLGDSHPHFRFSY